MIILLTKGKPGTSVTLKYTDLFLPRNSLRTTFICCLITPLYEKGGGFNTLMIILLIKGEPGTSVTLKYTDLFLPINSLRTTFIYCLITPLYERGAGGDSNIEEG